MLLQLQKIPVQKLIQHAKHFAMQIMIVRLLSYIVLVALFINMIKLLVDILEIVKLAIHAKSKEPVPVSKRSLT